MGVSATAFPIGNRRVGEGCPVFVIAEIGCNHENSFDRCCEMIVAAARCGADAAKLQSFHARTLVTRDAPKFWDIPGPGKTQYEEFEACEPRFTPAQYREMFSLAQAHGILLFSTPTDESWVDFLDELKAPAFKVASMDITHLPLLRHIARKGKPVILSTGASFVPEIRQAVMTIRKEGDARIVLLHCVSIYPTPAAQANLRMMGDLVREFPDCVIGYSDHTIQDELLCVPTLAVAMGARVVEKHFTFDRSRPGYDHAISADYEGFRRMVEEFRFVEQTLGAPAKTPTEQEDRARRHGRRSVVAVVDISKGEPIRSGMLAVKRPGTGIAPEFLETLYGKVATRNIPRDQVLTWEVLA